MSLFIARVGWIQIRHVGYFHIYFAVVIAGWLYVAHYTNKAPNLFPFPNLMPLTFNPVSNEAAKVQSDPQYDEKMPSSIRLSPRSTLPLAFCGRNIIPLGKFYGKKELWSRFIQKFNSSGRQVALWTYSKACNHRTACHLPSKGLSQRFSIQWKVTYNCSQEVMQSIS